MLEKLEIHTLVFDGYGTIFNLESAAPAFERIAPNRGLEILHWWRARQLAYTRNCIITRNYRDLSTLMDQALVDACKKFKLEISASQRLKLCEEYLTLNVFEEVPIALSRLKEKYKLVILSHGTQSMLDAVAEHNKITHFFDEILSVDAVKAYKPDLRAYTPLLQKINMPEENFGYVGINPMDIAGARAFGMKTIWMRRSMPENQLMGLIADITSANLQELLLST